MSLNPSYWGIKCLCNKDIKYSRVLFLFEIVFLYLYRINNKTNCDGKEKGCFGGENRC